MVQPELKETNMKRFLAVFTGTPDKFTQWMALPETERRRREAEGIAAWTKWVEDHAAVIDDVGGPLSRTKRIASEGITDVRNNLAGYTVLHAHSQEAAAALFRNHPHFTIFPGDAVEVMEVLPLPEV
jgi:energy-converting hydrogenase A subunit M